MCNPASGVFTKGHKAHWSTRSDSHEAIIKEHGLNADGITGPNIVRFEITPPNGEWTAPSDAWVYRVDQDRVPAWYDKAEGERAARAMLAEWATAKLVRAGDERDINDGDTVLAVCGGTVNAVWGGTVNEVCGGTVNEVCGGTVSFRIAFSCKLTGALAVIINRIGAKAKCYVETEKTRTIKGKG